MNSRPCRLIKKRSTITLLSIGEILSILLLFCSLIVQCQLIDRTLQDGSTNRQEKSLNPSNQFDLGMNFDRSKVDHYFFANFELLPDFDLEKKRKKRHENTVDESSTEEALLYSLKVPGNDDLLLKLTRSNFDVLTPNFVVQFMDQDNTWIKNGTKFTNEEKFAENFSNEKNACLYNANVVSNAQGASNYSSQENGTILNICGGMYGMIKLPRGLYFMEPFLSESNHSQHVLYKYSSFAFHDSLLEQNGPKKRTSPKAEAYWKRRRKAARHNGTENFENFDDQINHRSRRSISHEYHVELLVVADHRMLRYHSRNLENYVITLLSVAASIYRHPSLEAWINIALVKLIILTHENAGPRITSNAPETLNYFCKWQETLNDNDDENSLLHHDVAILLTRHDICRAAGKCDTLGLAELGTMCNSARSCAIIQDNGLSAAFTIAHELGHIFNMPHDDDKKCSNYMPLDNKNLRIMAHTLGSNAYPWSWSECSSKMLRRFLDEARPKCLYDRPVQQKYAGHMVENPSPGHFFNVDEQCQFIYGPSASVCSYMPTCKRLWCSSSENEAGCKTQHMPWADGTACALKKWCYHGECVGVSPDQLKPQGGGWGEWKDWQSCSRTCDSGVQKSERFCDNPRPSNGGHYCLGERVRYRSCNVKECPSDTPDFREIQCSEFNNDPRDIAGVPSNVRWVPQYAGISPNDRCKLYCSVESRADFYMMKTKVLDGTPCDRESDNICVEGQCKEAGCDGYLSSKIRRDECGICGGDGTKCHKEHGSFNERSTYGYNSVMKIKAGANNIDIRQKAWNNEHEDDNYLAVQNSLGEFILNGHFQVSSFHREIRVQGAILWYSGSHSIVERINSSKPVLEDLYLHILSVGQLRAPEITWEYLVLDDPSVATKNRQFVWRLAEWAECSASCQGTQVRQPICTSSSGGAKVDGNYCRGYMQPPAEERVCNTHCYLRWIAETMSQCSVACGAGQVDQRSACFRISWSDGAQQRVDDRYCQASEKPPARTPCFKDCEGRRWSYGDWTDCSKTCSGGVRRRIRKCVDSQNGSLDERYCENLTHNSLDEPCNTMPCPTWRYLDWEKCSVSCGGGVQLRHAYCTDVAGNEVDHRLCNSIDRHNRQKCNENICARWTFGPWGDCSTTCGNGTSNRNSQCTDPKGKALDEGHCVPEQKILSKPCHNAPCPRWLLSDWSPCSVTCMDGWKSRRVSCLDGQSREIDQSYCKSNSGDKFRQETHPSHMPCNMGACPFWRVQEWSKCSVSCGHGQEQRLVECVKNSEIVDSSFCRDLAEPMRHRSCERIACPQWKPGRWEHCSTTCGVGQQRRSVSCAYLDSGYPADDAECNVGKKPKSIRGCSKECPSVEAYELSAVDGNESKLRDDPTLRKTPSMEDRPVVDRPSSWRMGGWAEVKKTFFPACSVTCGLGNRQRYVACMDLYSRVLPTVFCSHMKKPHQSEQCQKSECPGDWLASDWESCPVTCGSGAVQRRRLECVDARSRVVLPKFRCDQNRTPDTQQACPMPRCPPAVGEQTRRSRQQSHSWRVGEWSQCSKSCGQGQQDRLVICKAQSPSTPFDLLGNSCPSAKKPAATKPCQIGHCYQWSTEDWSKCDKLCGGGRQVRITHCVRSTDDATVDATHCGQLETPLSARLCNDRPCRRRILWRAGRWSSCSVTCGNGLRQRHVACFDEDSGRSHLNSTSCDLRTKPPVSRRCRRLPLCPKWRLARWTPCSVTCGAGTSQRLVYCHFNGSRLTNEIACNTSARPPDSAPCTAGRVCPFYRWEVGRWSKCSRICGIGQQTREMSCLSNYGQTAPWSECDFKRKPPTVRSCASSKCPYVWVAGTWTTCSKSCGQGDQIRLWHCQLKILPATTPTTELQALLNLQRRKNAKKAAGVLLDSRHCGDLAVPSISRRLCSLGTCGSEYSWRVGTPWSQCSVTCGWGQQTRNIFCMDKIGSRVDRIYCEIPTKPPRRRRCFTRNCQASDCTDVKDRLRTNFDDHYKILVSGRMIRIYCHAMNTSLPKEYISLLNFSEGLANFAEFYGKRLLDPFTCPANGARYENCACAKEHTNFSGLTIFSKIRVDLRNMRINNLDSTFAIQKYGIFVPYATAGDCYSKAKCPQGNFNVDLRGTGFRITKKLEWQSSEEDTTKEISVDLNGAVINGKCGGYCGKCFPEVRRGLAVEVDESQFREG